MRKVIVGKEQIAGFSLIEMLLAFALMGIAAPYFIQMYQRDLAKKQAIEYADTTKTYAKAYARAITDNYATYYKAAAATPGLTQVLKGSQLQASGYLPAGVNYKNSYKQAPCVAIRLNTSNNQLEAFMFYVLPSGTANKLSSIQQGKGTMMSFGGEAGVVNSDGSITGSNWNLPSNSPFLAAASSCDGGTIPKYSVAVNLAMLPEYSSNLQTDPTLHRHQDNLSGTSGGDENNLNTMQTDITMQSLDSAGNNKRVSGIFLSGNANSASPIYMGSALSPQAARISSNYQNYAPKAVVLQNGEFKANTVQSLKTAIAFQPCASDPNAPNDPAKNQIGQIVTDAQSNVYQRQQLICSFNRSYCQTPNNTCYLPINSVTIQFHPGTTSFNCEDAAGSGYYIQPGSPQLTGNSIDPLGSENPSCSQQYDPINYHSTQNSNNGFDIAISPDRYVQNVGCYFGGCCSWHKTQTFTINSIACTNDTSTFVSVN